MCVEESALPVASQTPTGTDGTSFDPAFDYNRPPSCFVCACVSLFLCCFGKRVRHDLTQRVIHLPLCKFFTLSIVFLFILFCFLFCFGCCWAKQCHVNRHYL